MNKRTRLLIIVALIAALVPLASAQAAVTKDGLVVVAHGSKNAEWNDNVVRLLQQVNWEGPVRVAFLMHAGPRQKLDEAAAELDGQGVKRIIVVPLLVSSFSEHYEEIRYYVGERKDAPEHAHGSPLKTRAELILTPAMDDHPVITQILLQQVRQLSRTPTQESLVLVAHGPTAEHWNAEWLEKLGHHAQRIRQQMTFHRAEAVTLRDDAPKEVRDAATQQLRALVQAGSAESRVLVVPVLISVGHIQQQIRERLRGLDFVMSENGLVQNGLVADWIRQQAGSAASGMRASTSQ